MRSRKFTALVVTLSLVIVALVGVLVYQTVRFENLERYQSKLLAKVSVLNEVVASLSKIPPSPSGTLTYEDFSLAGYKVCPIAGTGSMEPTLNGSSHVLLANEPVSIGDIAIYENGSDFIIHRIIGEREGQWVFKGDAIDQVEYVAKDRVVWRVMAIIY
jgi:hypothetical protein